MVAALAGVTGLWSRYILNKLRLIAESKFGSLRPGSDSIASRDLLPFGRLWYGEPNAIGYAKFYNRSHDAVIRVYDEADNVIDAHEHAGEFKVW